MSLFSRGRGLSECLLCSISTGKDQIQDNVITESAVLLRTLQEFWAEEWAGFCISILLFQDLSAQSGLKMEQTSRSYFDLKLYNVLKWSPSASFFIFSSLIYIYLIKYFIGITHVDLTSKANFCSYGVLSCCACNDYKSQLSRYGYFFTVG